MRGLLLLLLCAACDSGVDCRLLNGGWHPDVSQAQVEKCRKGAS